MKNFPNYLTIANLICGCIAIVFILSSNPFLLENSDASYWVVFTKSEIQWGALFILIAALFDFLDGFAARALKIYSPLGKDLDSLSDVVSFGVAPSMIAFKGIWASIMNKPDALNVSMFWLLPAFLLAAGAAWRLATFNQLAPSKNFKGLPVPAMGIFWASLVLVSYFSANPLWVQSLYNSTLFWYILILFFVYLMNSKIGFLSIKPDGFSFSKNKPFYILICLSIILFVLFKFMAIPIVILVYIFYSIITHFFSHP